MAVLGGIDHLYCHACRVHVPRVGRSDRRYLIQSDSAMHHHGALASQTMERCGDEWSHREISEAYDLVSHAGRIREWSREVHHRWHTEGPSGGREMAHGRMECRGEQKDDPGPLQNSHRFGWTGVGADSQGLEYIRGP